MAYISICKTLQEVVQKIVINVERKNNDGVNFGELDKHIEIKLQAQPNLREIIKKL